MQMEMEKAEEIVSVIERMILSHVNDAISRDRGSGDSQSGMESWGLRTQLLKLLTETETGP